MILTGPPTPMSVRQITPGSTSTGVIIDNVGPATDDEILEVALTATATTRAHHTWWEFRRFTLEPGTVLVSLYRD